MGIGTTVLGIVAIVCAVWVIYDVIANQGKMRPLYKALWVIAAILFNILTAIIYYFTQKR
ncbi:PLDc N-terminal domain-containing protein [Candidatus Woesearchaeota archaeon]|nr:PLDc N-terminal domain-containing protein [Candidatus Woesearchaeota archaeon]